MVGNNILFENRKTKLALVLIGTISALLGMVVIIGWYISDTALIQVLPQFAPMQYNTALGFLLSGLALLVTSFNICCVRRVLSIAVLVLGGLTLSQYLFNISYGIDELFMDSFVLTKVSHPGRMAPNTALCFLIVGFALFFVKNSAVFLSLTVSLIVLTAVALLGYLTGVEGLYGMASLTRMAVHTATGFALISIAFVAVCWKSTSKQVDVWKISPFVIATVSIAITGFSWYSTKEFVAHENSEHFKTLIRERTGAIEKRFAMYEQAILGGVGFIKGSSNVNRSEWRQYAEALQISEYLPGTSGIGFIDYLPDGNLEEYTAKVRLDGAENFKVHPQTEFTDNLVIKYIEPIENNWRALGLDIGFEKNRRAAAIHARDTGKMTLTERISLVQDKKELSGFLLLSPVYIGSSKYKVNLKTGKSNFLGWVYSPFVADKFLEGIADKDSEELSFIVYSGTEVAADNMIFKSKTAAANESKYSGLQVQVQLPLAERVWTLVWKPSDNFLPQNNAELPIIIVVVGLISALLLSSVFYLLSRLYGQSARDREKLLGKLSDSNEELTRFAYVCSHDLQEPLRMVRSFSEKLYGHISHKIEDDEKGLKYFKFIIDGATRAQDLITDILAYSSINEDTQKTQEVDMNELVGVVKDNMQISLKEREGSITHDELPTVSCNKTQIFQLLQNLINNALKYQKSDVKPTVHVGAQDLGSHWQISVKDNGIGMEKKYLEKIFEVFQRLHRKEEFTGTGVGLSICKKVVERHGGKIWAESILGEGSTFHFTLRKDIADDS